MKPRKIGPSAPVAGLLRRVNDARDWTIPPHALPAVLGRHRDGSVAAGLLLHTAYERHIWRLAAGPDGPADHLIGHLWIALHAAIESLRTAYPTDIDRYIRTRMAQALPPWHLRHRRRWLHEDYPTALVRVPARTARRRRAAGLPPPLTRSTAPRDTAMPRQIDPSLSIDIDAAIDRAGPLASDIRILIGERGLSAREAAEQLGVSRHRIRVTLDALSEHLTD